MPAVRANRRDLERVNLNCSENASGRNVHSRTLGAILFMKPLWPGRLSRLTVIEGDFLTRAGFQPATDAARDGCATFGMTVNRQMWRQQSPERREGVQNKSKRKARNGKRNAHESL